MKAMKKEKLFTRNFTLLILGTGELPHRQLHPQVCPVDVCAGADRFGLHLCGDAVGGAAAHRSALALRRNPCRQGQPQTHHGGAGCPVRLIGTGGGVAAAAGEGALGDRRAAGAAVGAGSLRVADGAGLRAADGLPAKPRPGQRGGSVRSPLSPRWVTPLFGEPVLHRLRHRAGVCRGGGLLLA